MAAANEQLANQPTADLDIENVGEDQEQYVEMVCTMLARQEA
jgi:hypothetical protein